MLVIVVHKLCAIAVMIGFCVLIEMMLPLREEVSMKERGPGAIYLLLQNSCGVLITYPLIQLWMALGIGAWIVFPLADTLAPLGIWGMAIGVIVMLLVGDFAKYWWHRTEHAFFWPIHATHHSATKLHAAQNFGHPLQFVTSFLCIGIPLSFLQIKGPAVPLIVATLMTVAETMIHSPTKFHLGPLRRVFVDNRFHRIHHSIRPEHWDKNYGICFTIWDQLFGTAVFPKGEEWPEVGVHDAPPPKNGWEFLAFPALVIRKRFPPKATSPSR